MRLSAEEKCHSRSCISGALCKAVSSFGAHLELWTSERASEEPGHVHPGLLQHKCRRQCDQPPPWRRHVCHLCLQAQLPREDLEIPSKQANCNSSRLLGDAGDGWDNVEESSFTTKRAVNPTLKWLAPYLRIFWSRYDMIWWYQESIPSMEERRRLSLSKYGLLPRKARELQKQSTTSTEVWIPCVRSCPVSCHIVITCFHQRTDHLLVQNLIPLHFLILANERTRSPPIWNLRTQKTNLNQTTEVWTLQASGYWV